jgi:predicted alpha-1,6-mannanase (GH76 family)
LLVLGFHRHRKSSRRKGAKRDLEELYTRFFDELEERSFDDDELWARGPGASKAAQKVVTKGAQDVLHHKGTDAMTDGVKDQLPKHEPTDMAQGLAGASKKV